MFATFVGLVPLPRIRPTFLRAAAGELHRLPPRIYPFEPKRSPP